jgi:hypothetical protein
VSSSVKDESSEIDFFSMEQDGDALDGEGTNFCHACLAAAAVEDVGVVMISERDERPLPGRLLTLGDINEVIGDPEVCSDKCLDADDVDAGVGDEP